MNEIVSEKFSFFCANSKLFKGKQNSETFSFCGRRDVARFPFDPPPQKKTVKRTISELNQLMVYIIWDACLLFSGYSEQLKNSIPFVVSTRNPR